MVAALRILLISVLDLYFYVILAAVIASWLVGFGIINAYNPVARSILRALHALTEPIFAPVRRIIPAIGGLDLSPLIVLLLLQFLRNWLAIGTFF
jgi:YggT family protein